MGSTPSSLRDTTIKNHTQKNGRNKQNLKLHYMRKHPSYVRHVAPGQCRRETHLHHGLVDALVSLLPLQRLHLTHSPSALPSAVDWSPKGMQALPASIVAPPDSWPACSSPAAAHPPTRRPSPAGRTRCARSPSCEAAPSRPRTRTAHSPSAG